MNNNNRPIRPTPSRSGYTPPGLVYNLDAPSTFWRAASQQTLLGVAGLCRGFLFGLNKTEVHGLDRFLDLLKSRSNYRERQRGLLTVSNHVSVMDDPLIWGVLPFSFHAYHGYLNNRFGFGSHDICFKSTLLSHFFTLGQVLPTHRLAHSPHGGPYQPTWLEAIRLLNRIPAGEAVSVPWALPKAVRREPSWPRDPVDPFTDPAQLDGCIRPYFESYSGDERFYHAPSRYECNQFGWIHIFPEGQIHQTPTYNMRYFKWGVARLILEPPVCPDVVPIWIEGTDQVMHEARTWPRFIPRAGKHISVTFGDKVDTEARFGDLRKRWHDFRKSKICDEFPGFSEEQLGKALEVIDQHQISVARFREPFLTSAELAEVHDIWIETARRVREDILKLRRERGWPDEDPKASAAETWRREGPKRTGRMEDGSWVADP